MSTFVLALVSVKGGSGKSTSAALLAEGMAGLGLKVTVVDCDPQGTLLEWEAAASESGAALSFPVEPMPSAPMVKRRLTALPLRVALAGWASMVE